MSAIEFTTDDNLLIITVKGDLSAKDMIAVVLEYYPSENIKNVIWDLTNGSLQLISEAGFKAIAQTAKASITSGSRKGGKTAFVGNSHSEVLTSSIYKAIAEVSGVPTKYNVFRTLEDAKGWMNRN
jgi:hypothetical protein